MYQNLNREAIAFFCASGFFPGNETYLNGRNYEYSKDFSFYDTYKQFTEFQWYYEPRNISLEQATGEFASLLDRIVAEAPVGERIILALSGGLDSRTLAAVLRQQGRSVHAYSYHFENGHNESSYGKRISEICRWPFESWSIPAGYLWNKIDLLAGLNHCYSDFTHPRQLACLDQYESLGDRFCLGHLGDALFDDMRVDDQLSFDSQVLAIRKKISKRGGVELADTLWKAWNLPGSFDEYYMEKIRTLFRPVFIPGSANASIRAFKSKTWVARWTASNFPVYESVKPVMMPYFHRLMCDFVCRTPESLLRGRKIQIEYLKKFAPDLAAVSWQSHRPFNLYHYHWDRSPWNIPYRVFSGIQRSMTRLKGKQFIQRNWELQFTGESNRKKMESYLFDNSALAALIPQDIIKNVFDGFYRKDAVFWAHPIGMLLTISVFSKNNL